MQNNPLKSNENNFMVLLNFLADPTVIVDEKGVFLAVNDAVENLTGLSKKELVGMNFLEMKNLSPETKAIIVENLRKRMQGLHVEPYEISLTDKDGQTRYFELKAKKIDYAGKAAVIAILRDITRRKENLRRLKEYSEKMEALVNEKVEQIKESEAKYHELINKMNDTVWVIDFDGKFIDVNDATVKVLGYSREELLRMGPPDIDSSLTKEQILNLIRSMPADQTQVFETSHTAKDGTKIPVEISSSLVTYQGKQAILSIARDITERKKLEVALRASEEMFRAISTCASDAIVLLDETDQVVYWNSAAERIFGYAKKEATGKKLAELVVPPKFRSAHLETLKEVLEQKSQIVGKCIEVSALRKDGTELQIELTVSALKLKDASYMLEIIRDISERKKMEDTLKQERDMLEAVTENVGAGLAIISKDYRILWANKLLKHLNGDCEGKMCYSTFNRLTEVCPDCGVKKVFDNGVPIDVHEYSNQDDKGNRFWVELIVTPIKDKEGNVTAALELVVNITERKIIQNKLAEYSEKLEKLVEQRTEQLKQTQAKLVRSERLAAIGELAAMVGHDLRNPLTGIMGATYYLKTKHGAEVGAKGKEMLETIEKAIKYSNKIINDLLEYSRDLKLEFTETTPKVILQIALSLLEVPEKIQIVDATKDTPTVKVDTEKIRNVFVRIIQNAIDAMPEGGTLTIRSRKVNGTLEIVFEDTGIGMSEETLSKLKGGVPLFTTKAKGMGFGLPICKRIAEAHGGKLSVESTAGKGTMVTVTVPVNPEPADEGGRKMDFQRIHVSSDNFAKEPP